MKHLRQGQGQNFLFDVLGSYIEWQRCYLYSRFMNYICIFKVYRKRRMKQSTHCNNKARIPHFQWWNKILRRRKRKGNTEPKTLRSIYPSQWERGALLSHDVFCRGYFVSCLLCIPPLVRVPRISLNDGAPSPHLSNPVNYK